MSFANLLAIVAVVEVAVVGGVGVVILNLIKQLLLISHLRILIIDPQHTRHIQLMAVLVKSANENPGFLPSGPNIKNIASLSTTRLKNARLYWNNYFVNMACERIISNVAANIFDIQFFICLRLNIIENFTKGVRESSVEATFLLETWEQNLIQLNEQVFVGLLAGSHTGS